MRGSRSQTQPLEQPTFRPRLSLDRQEGTALSGYRQANAKCNSLWSSKFSKRLPVRTRPDAVLNLEFSLVAVGVAARSCFSISRYRNDICRSTALPVAIETAPPDEIGSAAVQVPLHDGRGKLQQSILKMARCHPDAPPPQARSVPFAATSIQERREDLRYFRRGMTCCLFRLPFTQQSFSNEGRARKFRQ